jgi:hydrogenase nickel incorporation protein HypA/HybF
MRGTIPIFARHAQRGGEKGAVPCGRTLPRESPVHEVSIVQALIEHVEQEVRQAGHTGRVVRLDLAIGRLSGASPDAIRFAYELLAPGTLVAAAELRIEEPLAVACCRGCGGRTPIEELVDRCPACGSPEITIEEGRDLLLRSIELEDEGPSQNDE